MKKRLIFIVLTILYPLSTLYPQKFAVMSDMQFSAGESLFYDTYFKGASEVAKVHNIDFIIVPGDAVPPIDVDWTIKQVFGDSILWYPSIGNHEVELGTYLTQQINQIQSLPNISQSPQNCQSIYSFDYGNSHFVSLNFYYDGYNERGYGTDAHAANEFLIEWLDADLKASNKPIKIVFGHEPAFVYSDLDNGFERYNDQCLDEYPLERDLFWDVLVQNEVLIYFCGHTHVYNVAQINNVYQINTGHSQGENWQSAPSTVMICEVTNNNILIDVLRDVHDGNYDYNDIIHHLEIKVDTTAPSAPKNIKILR